MRKAPLSSCQPISQTAYVGSVVWRTVLCIAALATGGVAYADLPTVINTVRAEGCAGERPATPAVEPSEALHNIARGLSRGGELEDSIESTGYPAASSASLYLKGPTNDAAIREAIESRYCEVVSNARFTDIGFFRSGNESWIVLAERSQPIAVGDPADVAARVLELVNAARGESRRCGRRRQDAVSPVTLSRALTEAAQRHADDMAGPAAFDHRGSDGSEPPERVSRTGYRWRATGENIAAGQASADAVVSSWLASPGHCGNIMGPQFTEMGVAYALAPSEDPAIYWTQVFAAPQLP
jgi:uncharacterized protein YkwD